ncbi:hypothetical protein [Oceaniglobus trochenteri]|uniref:hypothetical protein n=1 Tax=Oceaniglobus trochenteri TaxID=2763260 RepID=UPI001CFFFE1A|nr:hypothetical protein [Oceaniglobus trochenteri]
MTTTPDTSAAAINEIIAERTEKAAECHMILQAHKDTGRTDASLAWFHSSQSALTTANAIRALMIERDQLRTAAQADAEAIGHLRAERDEMRDALERIRLNQSLAECQKIASAALLPDHHDPDYRRYLAQQRGTQ